MLDWFDLQILEFRSQIFFEDIHVFEEYNLENSIIVSVVDHSLAYLITDGIFFDNQSPVGLG